jgi:STAS-like domain of unknown function (DUF4325)
MTVALTSDGQQEISLTEQGPDLSGRERGLAIRESVDLGAQEVVFNLYGVETVSPSFADELFGKLSVQENRPAGLKIANAVPDVSQVIQFAVRERQLGKSS